MQILSQHDQHQLLAAVNPKSAFGFRDRALILFALNTGLRVSELCALTVGHVCGAKPQGPGRMVRHALALPAALAKGGRPRTIALNTEARQAVANILAFNRARGFSVAPDAPLFPNRAHQAVSPRAVQRMLAGYRQAADLDRKLTPHALRHSFASRLLACDVPTFRVQKALGHARLSSTERYLHTSPDQHAADMERISGYGTA